MTLTATAIEAEAPVARLRISWIELSCLNCGELAGYIENARIVKPVAQGRIRLTGGRLNCGRCGGLLLSGERGFANSQASVG